MIINESYNEQRLPNLWKMANDKPLPKPSQYKTSAKLSDLLHSCPTSQRCVAKEFLVADYKFIVAGYGSQSD